ncbi:hypothetical protein AALB52_17200 [Lachnospiraceae bacterium 38-14]|nr:hypothetical protein D7Y06_16100 [Roseburia sp. 1XD42-69]
MAFPNGFVLPIPYCGQSENISASAVQDGSAIPWRRICWRPITAERFYSQQRNTQGIFETAYIQYNDENTLSYTISLALYAARSYYTLHREFPSGKGVADCPWLAKIMTK